MRSISLVALAMLTCSTTLAAPPPTGRCILAVTLEKTKLVYDDGMADVKGEMPRKNGTPNDVSALKPKLTCGASIWADDDVPYQDVIWTIDRLVKAGLFEVEVGDPKDPTLRKPKPPVSPSTWKHTTDDKADVRGRAEVAELAKLPVIIITKTEVTLGGKHLGSVAKNDFAEPLAKAMPPKPADYPTVILQADQSLPFRTIRTAVTAAHTVGYDNVLFAVKK